MFHCIVIYKLRQTFYICTSRKKETYFLFIIIFTFLFGVSIAFPQPLAAVDRRRLTRHGKKETKRVIPISPINPRTMDT